MRCKNCGTYNDDNRYICETCGSPLYDEGDINSANPDNDKTQTFGALNTDNNAEPLTPPQPAVSSNENGNKNDDKKSIIVIAILAVVLVAIIASIVVVAQSKKNKEILPSVSTISTTQETTRPTTEYTTEPTTESTTAPTTTEPTTALQTWYINVSSSGGGSVSGAGEYENGEKVVLLATADSDYEFDGWYSNGVKVSDKTRYTFTANENASFSAVFSPIPTSEVFVENIDGGLE